MSTLPESPRLLLPVLDTLRDEIVSLRFEPGMVLDPPVLRRRFAVSSTPLRDALLQLADEGLVEIFPRHATRVALIDPARLHLAASIRLALELEAVRRLALAADAPAASNLRSLIRQQAEVAAEPDRRAFMAADSAFHHALFVAAGMAAEQDVVSGLSGQMRRLRLAQPPPDARVREVIREHHAIIDAIESHRPAEAQMAVRSHLAHHSSEAEALRATRPDWFKAA